jgi:hypothetical protein
LIEGRAQLLIAPHGSAQFSAIPLGSGSWKSTLDGAGAARLTARSSPTDDACATCVQAGANGLAELTVENTSDQPATLENIHLTRQ